MNLKIFVAIMLVVVSFLCGIVSILTFQKAKRTAIKKEEKKDYWQDSSEDYWQQKDDE